ncbi:MAG: DNA primase catalytic subunit PriS [Halobacteriota archaeon]
MDLQTKLYLQKSFSTYYRHARVELPPLFGRREWAFILFDSAYPKLVMRRHKAFGSQKELIAHISATAPAHVYYSTACYTYPSATRMQDKQWNGADLIFDLDADKVLSQAASSYDAALEQVKKETMKLLDFLTRDFDFDYNDITIVFSGGRGYHVHLRSNKVTQLGSHERREVANYLTGTGLEAEYVLAQLGSVKRLSDATCWEKRINQWMVRYFERLRSSSEEDAIKELSAIKHVGTKRAQETINALSQGFSAHSLINSRLLPPTAWKTIVRAAVSNMAARIDVPVTADTKRLIRLPTSLHGGSGLRVTPLTFEELDEFAPLRDAVVFTSHLVPIRVLKPTITQLKDETIKVDHSTKELPEHTAIYLMTRGFVEYEPRRS